MKVGRTAIDGAGGIAAIRLTLAHRYICAGPGTPDQPCHRDVEWRPEIIYVTTTKRAWQIIKPGLVYRASEIDSASDDESIYYPPTDQRQPAQPVLRDHAGRSTPARFGLLDRHRS